MGQNLKNTRNDLHKKCSIFLSAAQLDEKEKNHRAFAKVKDLEGKKQEMKH